MQRNAERFIFSVFVLLVAAVGAPSASGPDAQRKSVFGEGAARPADALRPLPASFTARVEQSLGQNDPTGAQPVVFDVTFGSEIDEGTFTSDDLVRNGSAAIGSWAIENSGDDRRFVVRAGGLTTGTVIPTIAAGTVLDLGGDSNHGSVSADNSVTYGAVGCTTFTYLYAAVWSPPEIYVYCVEDDGSLTFQSTVDAPGDVRDMQISGDGKSLYYAHADLTRYTISMDGSIVEVGTRPVGDGSFDDLLLDPAGHYLYATHSKNGGTVYVYDAAAVATVPPQVQAVGGFYIPHGLAIDAAGQNIFIGNYFLPEEIVSFPLLGNGALNTSSAYVTNFSARAMYLVTHPLLDQIYWTETSGGSVISGRLSGAQVTYFDSDFSGWGARQLAIDDDGSHVYVTNYNNDDIGIFGVAGNGGLVPHFLRPTARRPEHLIFHPDWTYVYVASAGDAGDDSTVSIYRRVSGGDLLELTPETIASQGAYRLAIVDLTAP